MRGRSERGFTLVEALVGLAILSGTIIVAFETLSVALRNLQRAQAERRLIDDLMRQISEIELEPKLDGLRREGKATEGNWTIAVVPLADTVAKSVRIPFRLIGTVSPQIGQEPRIVFDTVVLRTRGETP